MCILLGLWVSIGTAVLWGNPEDIPPDRWPPKRGLRLWKPKPRHPEQHAAVWRKAKRETIGQGVLLVVVGFSMLAYLTVL